MSDLRQYIAVSDSDSCWPWTGPIAGRGYAYFNGKRAVRQIYTLLTGVEIPDHLVPDHICHNGDLTCSANANCQHRRCCNPAHQELVTVRVNNERGKNPRYVTARTGICQRGHAIVGWNVLRNSNAGPACRTCFNASQARLYHRNSEQINARRRAHRAAHKLEVDSNT